MNQGRADIYLQVVHAGVHTCTCIPSHTETRKLNNAKCKVILKILFILESILLKNSQEATTVWSRKDDLSRQSLKNTRQCSHFSDCLIPKACPIQAVYQGNKAACSLYLFQTVQQMIKLKGGAFGYLNIRKFDVTTQLDQNSVLFRNISLSKPMIYSAHILVRTF